MRAIALTYNGSRNPWSAKIVFGNFLKTPIHENCTHRKFGAIRYVCANALDYVAPPRHVDLRPFNFQLYKYI